MAKAGPEWLNPRDPKTKERLKDVAEIKPKTIIDAAIAVIPAALVTADQGVLKAVLVAQALDRLGEKLIEAAAINASRK